MKYLHLITLLIFSLVSNLTYSQSKKGRGFFIASDVGSFILLKAKYINNICDDPQLCDVVKNDFTFYKPISYGFIFGYHFRINEKFSSDIGLSYFNFRNKISYEVDSNIISTTLIASNTTKSSNFRIGINLGLNYNIHNKISIGLGNNFIFINKISTNITFLDGRTYKLTTDRYELKLDPYVKADYELINSKFLIKIGPKFQYSSKYYIFYTFNLQIQYNYDN